jgi:sensitive to high expression protein 9
VNDLLSRKSNWLASDVTRFTELVSLDHINEAKERETRLDSVRAEENVEKGLSELMRTILDRYHEEQVWSDKIRSLSTYGSLGITALNICIFLLALMLVEPYKRRRMVREVEGRIKERDEQNKDALREDLEDLRFLLLKNGGNLASWSPQEQRTSFTQLEPRSPSSPTIQQDEQRQQPTLATSDESPQPTSTPVETAVNTPHQPYAERDLWYIGAAGSIVGGVAVSLWQVLFR